MGYLKVVVAVITLCLIQLSVSAIKEEQLHAKLDSLNIKSLISKEGNKLATRDVTDCTNALTDMATQAQSLFSICTQTFNFWQQIAAELGTCSAGGTASASTCLTDIATKFTQYIQTVQSEVTTAFTNFGQDVGKLASCLTSSAPTTSS